jgi:hypothetical protein
MLYLCDVYREAIGNAYITLTIADCDREFLFADGGIVAQEPWSKRPMPFDLYAPLTPKLALNVLPLPNPYTSGLWVARLNAKGVARYIRIAREDNPGGADAELIRAAARFLGFSRVGPDLHARVNQGLD